MIEISAHHRDHRGGGRPERALGLAGPLSAAEYRGHLARLMAQVGAGHAGLGVVLEPQGSILGTAQWTRSSYRTRRVLAEMDRVCVDDVVLMHRELGRPANVRLVGPQPAGTGSSAPHRM
jgi:hypothetical protein